MTNRETGKDAKHDTIFVVVGEGGTHETLVPADDTDAPEPGYAFEVFVKASNLEEAVYRADDQLADEGWQDIEWVRAGEVEESVVDEDTVEVYERAKAGEVAIILYALSREDQNDAI